MDDRICTSCGGIVNVSDVACRHCGTLFQAAILPGGSGLHDFFRLLLGAWALALPAYCLYLGVTAPHGWGDLAAYLASIVYFIPWIVGIISLLILTWLTGERR